jgi:hypothetical protein
MKGMELHEEHVSKVYATIITSVKLCIELQDLYFCVQNLCFGLGDVCIFLRVSGCSCIVPLKRKCNE